eukprot:2928732-Pyramimonas_sp.AAC.1
MDHATCGAATARTAHLGEDEREVGGELLARPEAHFLAGDEQVHRGVRLVLHAQLALQVPCQRPRGDVVQVLPGVPVLVDRLQHLRAAHNTCTSIDPVLVVVGWSGLRWVLLSEDTCGLSH